MYEYTHVLPQIYRDDRLSINFLSLTAKNIEAKEADRRTCYRHQKKIEIAFWRPTKIKYFLSPKTWHCPYFHTNVGDGSLPRH